MWSSIFMIIFGIVALILAVKLGLFAFFFILSFLANIRKKMVEFCYDHKQSASPWLILVWTSIWLSELFGYHPFSDQLTRFEILNKIIASDFYQNVLLYIMIGLPFVLLLIRARQYFIPVLLIKILCIPLDIIYFICSFFTDDFRPLATKERTESNGHYPHYEARMRLQQQSGRFGGSMSHPNPTTSSRTEYTYNSTGHIQTTSNQPSSLDPMYFKYTDQHRVRTQGDTYSTATVDGHSVSYSGSYVPFGADPVSIVERDSDYAPFGGSDE